MRNAFTVKGKGGDRGKNERLRNLDGHCERHREPASVFIALNYHIHFTILLYLHSRLTMSILRELLVLFAWRICQNI